jgi:predicted HicB family RNase H-like nuclease
MNAAMKAALAAALNDYVSHLFAARILAISDAAEPLAAIRGRFHRALNTSVTEYLAACAEIDAIPADKTKMQN